MSPLTHECFMLYFSKHLNAFQSKNQITEKKSFAMETRLSGPKSYTQKLYKSYAD